MAREAPCFRPFLDRSTTSGSAVGLITPAQLARGDERDALLMLMAKATTALGGRGPATFMAYFDEFAHSQGAGSTSDSEELWQAVTPSLAQCGMDGFVYQGSSPWAQDGQFFVNYQRGLQVDPVTAEPVNHDILTVQFPSWALYRDAERGSEIEMWPGGPCYEDARPVITSRRAPPPARGGGPRRLPGRVSGALAHERSRLPGPRAHRRHVRAPPR